MTLTSSEIEAYARAAGWATLRYRSSGTNLSMAVSGWTQAVDDANMAYGYTVETVRPNAPDAREITMIDDMAILLAALPDTFERRVVALRVLWDDVRGRHVNSFRHIGRQLATLGRHVSVPTVSAMYRRGLAVMAHAANHNFALQERIALYNSKFLEANPS